MTAAQLVDLEEAEETDTIQEEVELPHARVLAHWWCAVGNNFQNMNPNVPCELELGVPAGGLGCVHNLSIHIKFTLAGHMGPDKNNLMLLTAAVGFGLP